jgi:hypothetical protein
MQAPPTDVGVAATVALATLIGVVARDVDVAPATATQRVEDLSSDWDEYKSLENWHNVSTLV